MLLQLLSTIAGILLKCCHVSGTKPTPAEYDNEIMDMLKKHTRNEEKDVRLTQPSLPDLSA